MRTKVLETVKDKNLKVYSVWLPILWVDSEKSVPNATKLLLDERVWHYWDADKKLGEAYKPILGIEETVWDVYLLFASGVEWKDAPPKPTYWQTQLSVEGANELDGEALAGEIKKLLTPVKK